MKGPSSQAAALVAGVPRPCPASPRSLLPPLLLFSLLPLLPPPRLLCPPLLPLQKAGPLLGHLILGLVLTLQAGTKSSG